MAQYGQILDELESDNEQMYKAFDDYFNHPTMVKIKDVNDHSMYMSKTYCLLSNECRYIIVFVTSDNMPKKSQASLLSLPWVSLQTRTLADNHELPPHGYQPRREGPLNVLITRTNVVNENTTYSCKEFPVTITLLPGKGGSREYQERGNIIAALETYQTIICLNG